MHDTVESVESQSGFVQYFYRQLQLKTLQCLLTLVVVFGVIGLCIFSYLYCKLCLLVIFFVCMACCLCVPGLNVPLWISIVLLVAGGYSFSNGRFSVIWG